MYACMFLRMHESLCVYLSKYLRITKKKLKVVYESVCLDTSATTFQPPGLN